MKKIFLFLPLLLSGCATLEWSNSYGNDYCAYPSGVIVGVPTTVAALTVASPPVAIGVGFLAGGTMILNSWSNWGGLDVSDCIESYKKNVVGKKGN